MSALMFIGVALALPWNPRDPGTNAIGLGWSIFGLVMNGLFYEALAQARDVDRTTRCLWQAVAVAIVGATVIGKDADWSPVIDNSVLQVRLIGFAFFGGFLYFLANIEAFDNLEPATASVLVQFETPAVVFGAILLLGEPITIRQGLGVGIAFVGARLLARLAIQQQSSEG